MSVRYKIDIMAALKERGYSSTRIREEKLIGQSYLQQIRHGELVSWKTIDTLCKLLDCQPGDIVEYIPDADAETNPGSERDEDAAADQNAQGGQNTAARHQADR